MNPSKRDVLSDRSARAAVEEALNLNRMYKACKAFPMISEVPDMATASRADVIAGYGRVRANRNLKAMCVQGEKDLRAEFGRAIEALVELLETPRPIDEKQPAQSEGLSVGREQECEHCYQDGRCLSEPCPRPPKYPRGYDEDADREWDAWEALKATLPSPSSDLPKEAE